MALIKVSQPGNPETHFSWRRFWVERGSEPPFDSQGFLYAPDKGRNTSLSHSSELQEERCVIFLGEPSSGKSKTIGTEGIDRPELECLAAAAGDYTIWLDLREVTQANDLEQYVATQTEFDKWKTHHGGKLYLFLDSLDECILSVPEISNVLLRFLRPLPVELLMLRITCRTAEWPSYLELELEKLYRQELFVLELAPLRQEDVLTAARQAGVDTKLFFNQIQDLNAVPFARKPSTLIFLLNLIAQGEPLPRTQWKLYEEGCRIRCDEYNKSRIASHKTADFTPDQLLEALSRIAALSIFTDRLNIKHESSLERISRDVLPKLAAVGGTEFAPDEFEITSDAVSQALETALFLSAGTGILRWETRNISEFLAARYLIRRKFTLASILSLIVHPNDKHGRVIPQLHGTAAWIAEQSSDVFKHIVMREVDLLLYLDKAQLTEAKKRLIATQLLEQTTTASVFARSGKRWLYERLKFSDIDKSLIRVLASKSAITEKKLAAIEILIACKVSTATRQCQVLALNKKTNERLRVMAVLAVAHHGNPASRAAMRKLLVSRTLVAQNDDELRGAVLMALWPDHLTFSELLKFLGPPKNPGVTGLYTIFVRDQIADKLPGKEIPLALAWAASNLAVHWRWTPEDSCRAKIIGKALSLIARPEIRRILGDIAYRRLREYEDFFPREFSEGDKFKKQLEADSKLRRTLLLAVMSSFKYPEKEWLLIMPMRTILVQRQDFDWMIETGLKSTSASVKTCCAMLVPFLATNSSKDLCLLYTAAESWPELKISAAPLLEAVQLNSTLAGELRAAFLADKAREDPQTIEQKRLNVSVTSIREILKGSSPDRWLQIASLLERTGPNSSARNTSVALSSTKGWANLQLDERNLCIDTAVAYIESGDPKNEAWFTTSSWPYVAAAGYQALVLLLRVGSDSLGKFERETWVKWTPIVLTFPREETLESANELAAKCLNADPVTFLALLERRIEAESKNSKYVSVVSHIEHLWNEGIAQLLMAMVKKADADSALTEALLSTLLARGFSEAQEFALKILSEFSATRANRDRALAIGHLLLQFEPRNAWDAIWNIMLDDKAFGRSLIESATHQTFGNLQLTNVLTESEMGQLLSWMFQNYPFRDELLGQAGPVSSVFTAQRFRDVLLQRLIARGTPESVRVLEQIQLSQPQLPWAYYMSQADAQLLQVSWVPPQPSEIRELTRQDTRLVNNGSQLSNVLKDALERIQQKLHAESEAVIELWNYSNTRRREYWPQDENDLSNWLKRRLEEEIVARGVIIAREVEIRRKRDSAGERTDLYVVCRHPATDKKIVVVVEVKGCWNADLKSAMKTQLAERYLKDNFYDHGIYVVGWFVCNKWRNQDRRKRMVPFKKLDQARRFFKKQAHSLSSEQTFLKALVMDIALR